MALVRGGVLDIYGLLTNTNRPRNMDIAWRASCDCVFFPWRAFWSPTKPAREPDWDYEKY
jgi:hypothetical protein